MDSSSSSFPLLLCPSKHVGRSQRKADSLPDTKFNTRVISRAAVLVSTKTMQRNPCEVCELLFCSWRTAKRRSKHGETPALERKSSFQLSDNLGSTGISFKSASMRLAASPQQRHLTRAESSAMCFSLLAMSTSLTALKCR